MPADRQAPMRIILTGAMATGDGREMVRQILAAAAVETYNASLGG